MRKCHAALNEVQEDWMHNASLSSLCTLIGVCIHFQCRYHFLRHVRFLWYFSFVLVGKFFFLLYSYSCLTLPWWFVIPGHACIFRWANVAAHLVSSLPVQYENVRNIANVKSVQCLLRFQVLGFASVFGCLVCLCICCIAAACPSIGSLLFQYFLYGGWFSVYRKFLCSHNFLYVNLQCGETISFVSLVWSIYLWLLHFIIPLSAADLLNIVEVNVVPRRNKGLVTLENVLPFCLAWYTAH